MKITRNVPDQLIVANVPWITGGAFIAFILIFVGLGMWLFSTGELGGIVFILIGGVTGSIFFALMVRRTQVIFDRNSDQVTMRERSVFGYKETHREFSDLIRAELEQQVGREGNKTYRPVLVFRSRGAEVPVPLVRVFTSFGGARVVEEINNWLDAGELDSGAEAP